MTNEAVHRKTRGITTRALLLAATLAASLVATQAPSASAWNGGSVQCMSGSNVVGVWVTVSGGTSGWAGWARLYGRTDLASWSYNTQGKSYTLTVGCGGTPAKWKTSSITRGYSTNWRDVLCWDRNATYGGGTGFVLGSCT